MSVPDPTQEDPTPGGAKKSGWGDAPTNDDESTATAAPPRRRRAPDADDDDEDENTRKHDAKTSSNKHDIAEINNDDDNDTIANLIPDLEDEQEDMARQVAEAPHLTKSRVQSIKELDDQIDAKLPSASEIGIDLSVLQAYLMPQEQVQDEDVPWDFSAELQALASEMQREQEERDGQRVAVVKIASPKQKDARVRKPLQEA